MARIYEQKKQLDKLANFSFLPLIVCTPISSSSRPLPPSHPQGPAAASVRGGREAESRNGKRKEKNGRRRRKKRKAVYFCFSFLLHRSGLHPVLGRRGKRRRREREERERKGRRRRRRPANICQPCSPPSSPPPLLHPFGPSGQNNINEVIFFICNFLSCTFSRIFRASLIYCVGFEF